jgi:hypothetical protein
MVTSRLLLALVLTAGAFSQAPPFFDVKQYGATGNGATLDTAAINKAIEACHAAGGGTVFFRSGTYLTGTIDLKSNVTLWLDAGAVIRGSQNLAHYHTGIAGQAWYMALILGKGVENVAIAGHGTIDGDKVFDPKGEENMRGPHAALFVDCRNVTVRDVAFKDAANYALIIRSTEGVNVDGMTARGGWDGINLHDVKNATISNCRLFTGDDCLAGAYWENVTVSNCVLNTSCNALRVGGRNVLVNNCLIYGPGEYEHRTSHRRNMESGFQILPHYAVTGTRSANKYVVPGPVDNLILSNILMHNVRSPFWVAYSADAPYSRNNLGVGRIIVNNLVVTDSGKTPFYVSAPADNPAKSIVLNNVRMTFAGDADEVRANGQGFSPYSILPSYGVYGRNVEHLELHDVRLGYREADTRPAVSGENIGVLELDRFLARSESSGAPPVVVAGLRRLLVDGKQTVAAKPRVKDLQIAPAKAFAGEPVLVTVTVENQGPEGLAEVPLRAGEATQVRNVWLKAGETARVSFVNVRSNQPGEQQVVSAGVSRTLTVMPKPTEGPVRPPYKTFQNTEARLQQLDGGFYIRAAGDAAVLDRADQYGAIYLEDALPGNGSITVKVENPDNRSSWGGRAGIVVRNDISKPGQSAGYLVLGSSPANGPSLEWDSDGDGRIDKYTVLDGYTVWPHWLKLERRGARFTGFHSPDGQTWNKVGEAEASGADQLLDAGVFTHRNSARFEGFRVGK